MRVCDRRGEKLGLRLGCVLEALCIVVYLSCGILGWREREDGLRWGWLGWLFISFYNDEGDRKCRVMLLEITSVSTGISGSDILQDRHAKSYWILLLLL